jgi:L-fuconolactonase
VTLVDAHLHLWDRHRFHYPWLAAVPPLDRSFLPADIGASGPVDRVVFVQADCLPEEGLDEARWVASLAGGWPRLAGIVAFAPLDDPESAAGQLERLRQVPGIVGARRLLEGAPEELLRSEGLVDGLRLLQPAGLVFDACITSDQLPALVLLASRVPDQTIVLDHLGKPPVRAGRTSPEARRWADSLRELAALPRTYVKLSGLAPHADPDRPLLDQVAPFLDLALETFGTERAMLGSDWPVSARIPRTTTYADWFALVLGHVRLGPPERRALEHGTAERVYGLAESAADLHR